MADIRTTGLLDDFERPDEDPIGIPWSIISGNVALESGSLHGTHFPPTADIAYWTRDTFVVTGTANVEVWGLHGGAPALADASRIGIFDSGSVQTGKYAGYQLIFGESIGGNYWNIQRFEDGDFTTEASVNPGSIGDSLILLRKTEALVETYRSLDGGSTWSLVLSFSDPSPFPGPWRIFLGTTGLETGWEAVGGGALNRTQIYRYVSN